MSWNQIAASAETARSIVAAEEDGSGGGWDLVEFFTNGQDYAEKAGGAFLGVVGVVCLLFAAWKIFQKLTNEQSRESWGKVAGLVLLGGVLLFGGYSMISDLAEGGKDTVDNFGDTGSSNAMPASTGTSDPLVIEIGDGAIARL